MNEQGEKMFELAEQLKELKDLKKSAEQELKEINDRIGETEYRLSELFQRMKFPTTCLMDGFGAGWGNYATLV
ncbi:hypothetical protein L1765_14240 [Microaerobacter geothermalis]|uniref:gp33 family protein n=1 Tax=Microaerobacter geothermalis TaxID=674972 RepID=UPI001F280A6D|nr:hypothetical protein [Microaerobacter geothermalis]MCF6095120.1 hypothetical protein [Microaerobacter geothermalis]